MNNFLYFTFFTLLFASCDVVVDLDIPEHQSVLVVNSILATDDSIKASISHSVGAFDASTISYVNNAAVEVYEDGTLLGLMDETASEGELGSDYEYHFNQMPTAGKTYAYEITHPEYEAVRAETKVPTEVQVTLPDVTLISEEDWGERHYRVRFSFNDAAEENFYRLRLIISSSYGTTFDYFESNDASIIASSGVQSDGVTFYGDEALFDDDLFNGIEKEISFDLFDYKYYWFDVENEDETDLTFTLELSSVTESYYTYIKSLRAHFNNQDQFLFAGEPVQVFTNIENGLGIFGAISIDTVTLKLP